jgi:hypothetical protein
MSFMLLVTVHSALFSQRLVFLFAHGVYSSPVDSYFKHQFNYGWGVEGGAGIGTGRTFLVGTVGYTGFNSVSASKYGNTTFVPIKAGLRHYILVGKILFLQVDAGLAHVQNEVIYGSRFTGDLGLGFKFGPFEAIATYDGYARGAGETSGYSSWIGIKAGIQLGL